MINVSASKHPYPWVGAAQQTALAYPCFLAGQMSHLRFRTAITWRRLPMSLVLTTYAGHECVTIPYGGPVWHASVAMHTERGPMPVAEVPPFVRLLMAACLEQALEGAGDKALGQWTETGTAALHCRRRMTAQEWGPRPWGIDLRGTPEGAALLEECAPYLPKDWRE